MNSTVIGALIGGGILFVIIIASMLSGRGDGNSPLSLFSPKLKAVIFTRPGSLIIGKIEEVASVVWVVNPALVYIADERTVTYMRTVRMFGFMQRVFKPLMARAVTIAKGDGFPVAIAAGAANNYRLSYGDLQKKLDLVNMADQVTAAEARRKAEREDEKGGLRMISWALFLGMVASVGVFVWLMVNAKRAGVI